MLSAASRSNSSWSERPRLLKASSLRTELGVATAEVTKREEEEEWIRRVLRREMGVKKGLSRERAKQPDLFFELGLEISR